MKKFYCCIIILVLIISLTSCTKSVLRSLPKYYDDESYIDDGFQDYTDFCKYYYDDETIINNLENNKFFVKVEEENIDNIKKYFNDFKKQLEFKDWRSNYDFDTNEIKTEDFYYIYFSDADNPLYDYDVYYFDVSEMILYYIHSNI